MIPRGWEWFGGKFNDSATILKSLATQHPDMAVDGLGGRIFASSTLCWLDILPSVLVSEEKKMYIREVVKKPAEQVFSNFPCDPETFCI